MFASVKNIVVGLSGGADSVALLHILFAFKEINIFAAHVNHNLRGAESDADEKFVRELCEKLNIPLKVFQLNIEKFTEETARILRYQCLEEARAAFGADKIAVGHNACDNAETVLMNLCRGAGLKGLGGIPPVNGKIIRPFIETSREEIERFLRSEQIGYVTDKSNGSNDYTRNRVRNIIIPLLEKEINPHFKYVTAKNAELLRCDEDFLERNAQEAYNDCADENGGINISKLTAFHPAISRRVIFNALSRVRGGQTNDLTSSHIASVFTLMRSQTGKEVHLPGAIAERSYGYLFFHADREALPRGFYHVLNNPQTFIPETGKTVIISFSPPEMPVCCTKSFSYDKIIEPIVLRTRQNGDKISFKNGGKIFTKKLQDFFTDEKVPRSQRGHTPLIAHGGEILWIIDKNRVNAEYEAKDGEKSIYISIVGEANEQ